MNNSFNGHGAVIYGEIISFINPGYMSAAEAIWEYFGYSVWNELYDGIGLQLHSPVHQSILTTSVNVDDAAQNAAICGGGQCLNGMVQIKLRRPYC